MKATRHAEFVGMDEILEKEKEEGKLPSFSFFARCELFVTCEPCIMCASALLQMGECINEQSRKWNWKKGGKTGIGKVYFGCSNERFGGCGSVLSIHKDSSKALPNGYPVVSGIMKEEAISIMKKFYTLENKNGFFLFLFLLFFLRLLKKWNPMQLLNLLLKRNKERKREKRNKTKCRTRITNLVLSLFVVGIQKMIHGANKKPFVPPLLLLVWRKEPSSINRVFPFVRIFRFWVFPNK